MRGQRACPECGQTGDGSFCHHWDAAGERKVPTRLGDWGQSDRSDVERERATEVGGGSRGVSKPGLPARAEHLGQDGDWRSR